MKKSRRKSGQSVVIGTLLLLALFVAFIAWFQITQIPTLNQDSESNNNDLIESDMFELQDKVYNSILDDEVNQVSFNTKVSYKLQISGFQDKIGQFMVTEFTDNPVEFRNENTSVDGLPTETISLEYKPSYLERTEVPFVFENGILVENQTSYSLDRGGQRFIRGNDIFIFELQSEFYLLQSSNPTLFTVPENELQETEITGIDEDTDGDGETERQDIEIELNTTLSEDVWTRLLDNEDNVLNVEGNGDSVIVTLDGLEEYTVHTGTVKIEL